MLMGDVDSSPELAKAPKVLQDELLFPVSGGHDVYAARAQGNERVA